MLVHRYALYGLSLTCINCGVANPFFTCCITVLIRNIVCSSETPLVGEEIRSDSALRPSTGESNICIGIFISISKYNDAYDSCMKKHNLLWGNNMYLS